MDDIPKLLRPKLEVDGGSPPPTLEKDMILEDIEELTLSQLSALHLQQEKKKVQKRVRWEEKESVEECVGWKEKESVQKRIAWEEKESVESVGLEEADRPASCLSSLSSSSSSTSDFSLRSSYTLSIRSTSSGSLAWTSDSEQGDRDECGLTDKELPLSSEAVIQDALTKRMKRGIRRIFRRIVGLFACCCCAQTTEEEI